MNNNKLIYLDNAATTFPKPNEVYEYMDFVNRNYAVNAGRGGYELSKQAVRIIDDCREKIADLINTETHNIVLAQSITIALNQILNGIDIEEEDNIYVSPYEHNAILRTVNKLKKTNNINIIELPLNDKLEIDIDRLEYMFVKKRPKCVCCTHISNVTGYVLPVENIFEIAKRYEAITILDTAQSLGYIDVKNITYLCDFIAFAGHKSLYGALGVGGFANINGYVLKKYITGGTGSDSLNLDMPLDNQLGQEASSYNVVAIASLAKALSIVDYKENYYKELELTRYAISKLKTIKELDVISYEDDKQLSVISFTTKVLKSDELGMILNEDYNIAVRTGYHCAAYIHKHLNDISANGTVRIGIGMFNTKEDIDNLANAIDEIIND